ncbi:MAG: UDP-N-acetylmuramate dehydrogenase [Clostridia bacterium]|nr:UDP-N-acetylmuramate dehydrogenase [Clostridia bacterium]
MIASALQAFQDASLRTERDVSLAERTSFRIGGKADLWVTPDSEDGICRAAEICTANEIPFFVIGKGSNLLADDDGFRGCVLSTENCTECRVNGTGVHASAGVSLTGLAVTVCNAGLSGFSFAYGIPGTVGGALLMNAGAYGGETADVVTSVFCYDPVEGTRLTLSREACEFGYRSSVFQKRNLIILGADFRLSPGNPEKIREEMKDYLQRRKDKQPLEYPSAGSVFRRYPGTYTSKLIDEAGLRGFRIGDAQVSEKHAGFIVNRGHATSAEVRQLISVIRDEIKRRFGIDIVCEIRTIPQTEL